MRVRVLIVILAAAFCAGADVSEAGDPWLKGPFSFYVENDSLPLAGGDESYTQGLELHLTLTRARSPLPIHALRRLTEGSLGPFRRPPSRTFDQRSSFLFGQTIFTPQNIITYEPRLDDRPFVGHLYFGVASILQADEAIVDGTRRRPRRITARLTVGATGPIAGAHTAQAAFHVLRESRIPKGWYTEASFRPEAAAVLTWEELFALFWLPRKFVDLTTVGQASLGSTQTYGSAATTLRVGWGLSGFPPVGIPQSAADDAPKVPFEVAVFAGAEGKAMAWNRLADRGDPGRPDFKPFVHEWRVGASARLKNGLSVSYAVRRRSQEIEPLPPGLQARHWIGSLQIAKSTNQGVGCTCKALKGLRGNFGLGRGGSRIEEGPLADPRRSLAGHWGIETSVKADRFAFALEATGVAREHGRGDQRSHSDTFLLAKVATLGVELVPDLDSRHRLQLRAGGGMSLAKTQTTPSEGDIEEPRPLLEASDKGSAVLGGLRYTMRLGKPVSLMVNGAYGKLFLSGDETGVRRAEYWTVTGGVQLHPWARDRKDTHRRTEGPSAR